MWKQVRGLVGAVTCETRDLAKRHKKRGLKKKHRNDARKLFLEGGWVRGDESKCHVRSQRLSESESKK